MTLLDFSPDHFAGSDDGHGLEAQVEAHGQTSDDARGLEGSQSSVRRNCLVCFGRCSPADQQCDAGHSFRDRPLNLLGSGRLQDAVGGVAVHHV